MNPLSFLKEFLKKGEISPTWASPPNRASSLPYEQHLNENKFIDLILYGSEKFDDKENRNILMCTIKFIKGSQRFGENLL